MQIRYTTPITHETAVKMLGKVRRELARQRCSALVSKIIDPLCAVCFAVPMLLAVLYRFNDMAGKKALALAARVPKYTELADFVSVKVPALVPHGADNPLITWAVLAVLIPVAVCFVVSAVIRLVYRPKVEKAGAQADAAETARTLYDSVHKMCVQDNARASGKVNTVALSVVLLITLAFEVYICRHLYPTLPEADRLAAIGGWVTYFVLIGLACLLGLGITESLVAIVSGASNRYGASSIEKDCYDYLCSVDPDENARRMSGVLAVPNVQRHEKTAGLDRVIKLLSGRYKAAVLCCVLQSQALSAEQLEADIHPDDAHTLRRELGELVNAGLVAREFEKAENADVLRLTEDGKALAGSIAALNAWGKQTVNK